MELKEPVAATGTILMRLTGIGPSGDQVRHRISRAGNRQINRTLHTLATVQLRYRAVGCAVVLSGR